MTTAEYLILITALSLIAGAMIYFRVTRRCRAKAVDFDSPDTISISKTEDSGVKEAEREDSPAPAIEVRLSSPAANGSEEREYLDDMEDAAAGLARLLHSSESDRAKDSEETQGTSQDEVAEVESVVKEPSVESVLGEEVIEQIDRIDSELDALEELVASIEESLEAFSSLGEGDLPEAEEEESMAEAA